jgi:pimeloyl-[acyl-carrier protein] methyl ester esterase
MMLHAESVGRGPALVLLHGWGLHSGVWSTLIPQLADRFRVTSIDLPGHGHSAAPRAAFGLDETAAAVARIAPRGAAWIGWSLGGQVALAAAIAGAVASRLVLVATTPRFVTAADWPCAMAPATLAGFAASLAEDHNRTVRNFLTLQLRGDRRAALLLAELREVLAQRPAPAAAALAAGLAMLAATDLRGATAAVRQPVLVIAGERDRLTPAEAGRRLAAALPDGRYLGMAGAGHAPFLSAPDEFLAAIDGFLADEQAA